MFPKEFLLNDQKMLVTNAIHFSVVILKINAWSNELSFRHLETWILVTQRQSSGAEASDGILEYWLLKYPFFFNLGMEIVQIKKSLIISLTWAPFPNRQRCCYHLGSPNM